MFYKSETFYTKWEKTPRESKFDVSSIYFSDLSLRNILLLVF